MKIDRMELADCFTSEQILTFLIGHLREADIPVPLAEIAQAVGIEKIKLIDTDGFEGALISNPEKSRGYIVLKADSYPRRLRFTLGHELGHFLIPSHTPTYFNCSEEDIELSGSNGSNSGMEVEANQFAANLLMPVKYFRAELRGMGEPDIGHIVGLSDKYDVSVEAASRRYVSQIDYSCCLVFSRGGRINYIFRRNEFPYLPAKKNDRLPRGSPTANLNHPSGIITDIEEVESHWWLDTGSNRRLPKTIYEQSFYQSEGYRVTLLWFNEDLEDEDDDDVEWEPPRFKK